jgi:hypothetical protein
MDAPDSGDVLWSDQEGLGSLIMVENGSSVYRTVEMQYGGAGRSRKSEHCGEERQCASDSGDVLWLDQEGVGGWTTVDYELRSAHGRTREWRCIMVGPGW